ncbi:MAG: hypothetical protein EXQ57_07130 [Bryobacterales bacterium]|nr:hypothetical protein [Bryobacterales bacterium]
MLSATRLSGRHTGPVTTSPAPQMGGSILPLCCPTVLTGFMPTARLGDQTAHGGVLVIGEPSVLIG